MEPPVTFSRAPGASFVLVLVCLAVAPGVVGAALQPISRVREMARAAPGTRVTVRGVVTRYRPGRSLSVQDQSGSIFIYTEDTTMLVPGDLVEVTGLADVDEDKAPSIDKATYQKVGVASPPQPIAVPAGELAQGRHEADLVSVDGAVVRIDIGRDEYGIVSRAGDIQFTSWVLRDQAGMVPSLAPGTQVRITGAASFMAPAGAASRFELLMRSGGDAVILQPPSWWTPKRVSTAAMTLGGTVALLLSYVVLLRRQVERQTAVIRERLQAEAALTEQYRQAQKMEAVGRLAGGIAHDFNNIMTVVLGHSEILALELKDHPEMRTSVTEIQNAAERAAALTRQLLAFGRRQTLAASAVDLNSVARDMVSLLARVLGGQIEVSAHAGPEPVTVTTDRAQLEQALLNLAVNARDAMPDGGRLILTVTRRATPGAPAFGVLSVADTGTGIPPAVQPHIFDPFFTTKDVGRGSGLGLAMVYGFMQQSGGTIRFDSVVGAGTTFELAFPLAAAPDGALEDAAC
jgi:signal transduction histidine kinase